MPGEKETGGTKDELLGAIAVERGFLTAEKLDDAIAVHARLRDEMGTKYTAVARSGPVRTSNETRD